MLLKLILNLNFWRRKRWNKENFLRAYNVKTKEKNRSTFGKFNVCYTKFKVFLKVFFLHIIHTTYIHLRTFFHISENGTHYLLRKINIMKIWTSRIFHFITSNICNTFHNSKVKFHILVLYVDVDVLFVFEFYYFHREKKEFLFWKYLSLYDDLRVGKWVNITLNISAWVDFLDEFLIYPYFMLNPHSWVTVIFHQALSWDMKKFYCPLIQLIQLCFIF